MVHIAHPSEHLSATITDRLRALAPAAENLGQLHPEQLDIIHQQGWLQMLVPKAYGGQALSLPTILQKEESLAWADGSVGWVVTLCSGAGWFAGFLAPALASTLFKDPQVCIAGSGAASGTATLTEEGYSITGFWNYASGALHATAFTANCQIVKEGRPLRHTNGSPVVLPFLLKKEAVTLHRTWKTVGMIATGSHAFEAKDVQVPASHCFTIVPENAQVADPIYQYPFLQLAETTLAVNLSGMAIRFLDLCATYKEKRAQTGAGHTGPFQQAIQQAEQHLHIARQKFYDSVVASWDVLLEEGTISPALLTTVSTSSKNLVLQSRQLVNNLFRFAGLEAAVTDSEINRVWRNFHTAGQHALFSPAQATLA